MRHATLVRTIAAAATAFTLASSIAAPAEAVVLVDCAFSAGPGDSLVHGFYSVDHRASTLGKVRVAHRATGVPGVRTIAMTARAGGTPVGAVKVTRALDAEWSISTFDFGNVAIPSGAVLSFAQQVTGGDAAVEYNVGEEPCSHVVRTDGTTGAVRGTTVGVIVEGSPEIPPETVLASCPFVPGATGGDSIERGFYVDDYQGVTLDLVWLRYYGRGTVKVELTARLGSFDGPAIGVATVSRDLPPGLGVNILFDFGDVRVPAGSRIAFRQRLIAGAMPQFNVGFGTIGDAADASCPDIAETNGTAAPLDTVRRSGVGVKITGQVASYDPIPAVEYFHTGFGHYFLTAQSDEIAGLDAGAYGGVFERTGAGFNVWDGPVGGAMPVCRFFTTAFAPKSSHFYTVDAAECAAVKANPNWQYEKVAFYVVPTPSELWLCRDGRGVYRMYNDGMTGAPNHRYTTDSATYDEFTTSRGWLPEGVRFCAPR